MLPYLYISTQTTGRIIKMKLQESIYALLDIDEQFYPSLFYFADPLGD
ncbi:hypothetical protein [Coprobacter sp.]